MRCSDGWHFSVSAGYADQKFPKSTSSRGRRSRNKVSVGEPAEGSLMQHQNNVNSLKEVIVSLHGLTLNTNANLFLKSISNWIFYLIGD